MPNKRGRPRKTPPPPDSVQSIHSGTDGGVHEKSIPLPHSSPTSFDQIWDNALTLAGTISDHYAMRRDEQQLALQYALILEPDATVVELGVAHGHTAAMLCYAAQLNRFSYYGVDNFSLEGTPDQTRTNLKRLGLPFHLLVGDTRTVPWNRPIDYLLIDAGHDYISINQDCLKWLSFVKPGGLVLFHDYNPNINESDPHWGIKYAADRFTATWSRLDFMEWLLIKRKPFA